MHRHPQQWVYVLRGDGCAKIGATTFLADRVANQPEGELVRSWHRPHDAVDVERLAHDLIGVSPCNGREWFPVDVAAAIEAVERALNKADQGYKRRAAHMQASIRKQSERRNFAKLKRSIIESYDKATAPDADPDVAATKGMYGFMIGIINEIEDGVPANEIMLSDMDREPRR